MVSSVVVLRSETSGDPGEFAGESFDEKSVEDAPVKELMGAAERSAMIEEHWEVGKRLAWSFLAGWRIRMNGDEVVSIVGAALCDAAARFDPSKGVGFKTFLFYYLRGMLLKEISRIVNEKRLGEALSGPGIHELRGSTQAILTQWPFCVVENNNPERLLEKRELSASCWRACADLDALEREVVFRHFINDESLKEIASTLGYCRCHISRVKSTALAKLESRLQHLSGDGSAKRPQTLGSKITRNTADRTREREAGYKGGRGRSRSKRFDELDTLRKLRQVG